jgi:SAM-dependent methyltransferase
VLALERIDDRKERGALMGALSWLASESEQSFASLFDPSAIRMPVVLSTGIAEVLVRFGLIRGEELYYGVHRIRRVGSRFYVMEMGDADEYFQDVWPETDALLAALDGAPPGRLLDMGTGTGIVAIEAAARGHRVIATDLFESVLKLARFNAALNGIDSIEWRQGHLFTPVQGERFDLILTAPHYTRVNDQLRLEAMRTGMQCVAPSGRLVIATVLEWEGDGPYAAVEVVLGPMAEHAKIDVRPMPAAMKREWFSAVRGDASLGPLVSRHRFTIALEHGSSIAVHDPAPEDLRFVDFVPLSRLRGGASAAITGEADVDALHELLMQLRAGITSFPARLPGALLDACRFGERTCVHELDAAGAAGAILDRRGGVRPCTHGDAIGRWDQTREEILAAQRDLAARARERRGCDRCAAAGVCSRCLFPFALSETAYCNFIREHADELPVLMRLLELMRYFAHVGELPAQARIKVKRCAELLVARGRPFPQLDARASFDTPLSALRGMLREQHFSIVSAPPRFDLVLHAPYVRVLRVDRFGAEVAELVADGANATELSLYRRMSNAAGGHEWRAVHEIDTLAREVITPSAA